METKYIKLKYICYLFIVLILTILLKKYVYADDELIINGVTNVYTGSHSLEFCDVYNELVTESNTINTYSVLVNEEYKDGNKSYYYVWQSFIIISDSPIYNNDVLWSVPYNGVYYTRMNFALGTDIILGSTEPFNLSSVRTNANYYIDIIADISEGHQQEIVRKQVDLLAKNIIDKSELPENIINMNGMEFDDNGNVVSKIKYYDLEVPLNVKVKDTEWFGDTPKKVRITWEQSEDVIVDGWQTEIYVQQKGATGKYIWSVINKKSFTTPYFYENIVSNYEGVYNCNILNYKKTSDYIDDIRGYSPQIVTIDSTNFMLRNKWTDEEGYTHYSDMVYLKDDGDGNYIANVVKSKDFDENFGLDENGFVNGLIDDSQVSEMIDTENEYYHNEDANNDGSTIGEDFSITEILGNFKKFLGDLPGMISDVVSFLPSQFMTLILLGVGIVIALRVLGR